MSVFNGENCDNRDGSRREREGKNPYSYYQNFSEHRTEHNKCVFQGIAETGNESVFGLLRIFNDLTEVHRKIRIVD